LRVVNDVYASRERGEDVLETITTHLREHKYWGRVIYYHQRPMAVHNSVHSVSQIKFYSLGYLNGLAYSM